MSKQLYIGILMLPVAAYASGDFEKDWSGKYLGGNVGGIFNRASLNANQVALSSWNGECQQKASFSSAFIGGQYGIQKQFKSHLTFGVEGDYTFNFSQSTNAQCDCQLDDFVYDSFNVRNHYQASVKGRLGYAYQHNLQPFFAAGVSFAELGMAYSNEGGNTFSHNQMRPGYVVGGGIDWAYSEKWNLRLEYYYNQYEPLSLGLPYIYDVFDSSGMGKLNLSSNNIRAAVNYWF